MPLIDVKLVEGVGNRGNALTSADAHALQGRSPAAG